MYLLMLPAGKTPSQHVVHCLQMQFICVSPTVITSRRSLGPPPPPRLSVCPSPQWAAMASWDWCLSVHGWLLMPTALLVILTTVETWREQDVFDDFALVFLEGCRPFASQYTVVVVEVKKLFFYLLLLVENYIKSSRARCRNEGDRFSFCRAHLLLLLRWTKPCSAHAPPTQVDCMRVPPHSPPAFTSFMNANLSCMHETWNGRAWSLSFPTNFKQVRKKKNNGVVLQYLCNAL